MQIVFFSPDSITFVYNNAACSPPPPPPPHFIYNRGQWPFNPATHRLHPQFFNQPSLHAGVQASKLLPRTDRPSVINKIHCTMSVLESLNRKGEHLKHPVAYGITRVLKLPFFPRLAYSLVFCFLLLQYYTHTAKQLSLIEYDSFFSNYKQRLSNRWVVKVLSSATLLIIIFKTSIKPTYRHFSTICSIYNKQSKRGFEWTLLTVRDWAAGFGVGGVVEQQQ